MVAVLAAGLAMPAAAQQLFEGSVTGTMSLPKGKTAPFKYYQLGSRVRQEFTFEQHTMASIYDGTTGDMIMLMSEQKKYMVMNMHSASGTARQLAEGLSGKRGGSQTPDFSKMKVTPTGQRETIAGIGCDHYLFENTEDTGRDHKPIDICGAPGLGFMGMAGQQSSMMPSTIALLRSQNPELAKLARQGFFPLKMIFTGNDGTVIWQATQVDRRRPDAALFRPPAGYTEMVIPTMPGLPGRKP